MIPDKTPILAALAWIVVATAYAWVSNRDYDDAVLTHQTPTTVGRNKPEAFPADAPISPETAKAPSTTLRTGLFRPTAQGEHP